MSIDNLCLEFSARIKVELILTSRSYEHHYCGLIVQSFELIKYSQTTQQSISWIYKLLREMGWVE